MKINFVYFINYFNNLMHNSEKLYLEEKYKCQVLNKLHLK